ncbi:hypothetical protein J6590_021651 [Homalodisca vitripennis]|nr:hypothetical protein J6590_021651 [Homalodisca vitripennis]
MRVAGDDKLPPPPPPLTLRLLLLHPNTLQGISFHLPLVPRRVEGVLYSYFFMEYFSHMVDCKTVDLNDIVKYKQIDNDQSEEGSIGSRHVILTKETNIRTPRTEYKVFEEYKSPKRARRDRAAGLSRCLFHANTPPA